MNTLRRAFLLVALVVSLGYPQTPTVPALTSDPQQNPVNPKPPRPRQETVAFKSKLIGKTLSYNVVLPLDYDEPDASDSRYPVLYLLHGLFGHYDNWLTHTKLSGYAWDRPTIIVMPEGSDGWYTDSATVPSNKYETYVIEELIPDVQQRYRTFAGRPGRAIAGLSMGGYGALKFGVKYPDKFVFVASLSGALGAASWTEADLPGHETIWRTMLPVFGPEGSSTRRSNDLFKLYGELTPQQLAALPFIYLDCGTEDALLATNRNFVDILLAKKIPHEYRQLPGKHEWSYWDKQVGEVLQIMMRWVRRPPPHGKIKLLE